MIDFLRNKKAIVYAHNGGKFDYHQSDFLTYLNAGQEVMVINGRLARFEIGLCEFRDSWNILPVPLSAYKKDVVDYRIFEADMRDDPEHDATITRYLKNDCLYLHELVTQHVEEFGLKLTQAGASMASYQKMQRESEDDPDFTVPRSDAGYFDELKPFYFGGRVQCFERGIVSRDFEVVDINSAYPTAMMHAHPFGLSFYRVPDWKGKILGTDFVEVECVAQGCFPLRMLDGRLEFPHDGQRRVYSVTGWEFIAARNLGLLLSARVVSLVRHSELRNFRDYISHYWERRKVAKLEGDAAGNILNKLAMNSLYGKFASDPRNYGLFHVAERGTVPIEKLAGCLGPFDLEKDEMPYARQRFYNVATAASITGFVRAMLMEAIAASDGVLYCDTDSIAASSCKVDRSRELGDWSSEGFFDQAYLAGKKLYAFRRVGKLEDGEDRWKVRTKGVRLSHQEMKRIATGSEVEYLPLVPTYSVLQAPRFVKRKVRATT